MSCAHIRPILPYYQNDLVLDCRGHVPNVPTTAVTKAADTPDVELSLLFANR